MNKTSAILCLLLSFLAPPQARAARTLNVNFTISGTEGFNGVDAASVKLSRGHLSGTVTVVTPDGTFPCRLNAGSIDIRDRLNLTCTIGPDEMVTLSGKLKPVTGAGKGKFSETFFKEAGTYTAAK